jgi:hypothetical protein
MCIAGYPLFHAPDRRKTTIIELLHTMVYYVIPYFVPIAAEKRLIRMNGPSIARRVGEILAWITIIGVSIYSVFTLIGIFTGVQSSTDVLQTATPDATLVETMNTTVTATAIVTGTGAIQIIIPTTAPNLPSNPKAPARATAATITIEALTPSDVPTVTLTGTQATATVSSPIAGTATATKTATATSATTVTIGSPSATPIATTAVATATTAPATATKTLTPVPATATPVVATATETDEPTATDEPETPTP